jgi:hypothetical protein
MRRMMSSLEEEWENLLLDGGGLERLCRAWDLCSSISSTEMMMMKMMQMMMMTMSLMMMQLMKLHQEGQAAASGGGAEQQPGEMWPAG